MKKDNNSIQKNIPAGDMDDINPGQDANHDLAGADDFFDYDYDNADDNDGEYNDANEEPAKKKRRFPSIHLIFLLVFVLLCAAFIFKLSNWGERIDINSIVRDESGQYIDVLDQILPALDAEGKPIRNVKNPTILAFGNAPFADDRDSEDNLARMIEKQCGGTVYNCSVSGSYLASEQAYYEVSKYPMDAYCFYWLITLAVNGNNDFYYEQAANALGEDLPEGAQEAFDILTTIDMNEVDVITVMYDATDYLMGHEMYDDANDTNVEQFTGNLEAGIEVLHSVYPEIRVIVMSPTYAYAIDEEGNYVSSDMYTYGWDVLSTYVIKQYGSCASRQVTFIDHLYGTITEANADEYLIDNLHLNVEGRKLVAKRFMDALNYYDN